MDEQVLWVLLKEMELLSSEAKIGEFRNNLIHSRHRSIDRKEFCS